MVFSLLFSIGLWLTDGLSASAPSKVITLLDRPTGPSLTETDCLTKNGYKEEKCQAQVDALYECCNAFYQARGDTASTVSCPKASLLRLKMKQRANDNNSSSS